MVFLNLATDSSARTFWRRAGKPRMVRASGFLCKRRNPANEPVIMRLIRVTDELTNGDNRSKRTMGRDRFPRPLGRRNCPVRKGPAGRPHYLRRELAERNP